MTGTITRRGVLVGAGSLVAGAMVDSAAAADQPDELVDGAMIVFADYSEWALGRSAQPLDTCTPQEGPGAGTLVISDASPSVFSHHDGIVLVRPAALEALPASTIAALAKADRSIVLSVHGDRPTRRPHGNGELAFWQRLAELIALVDKPLVTLVDLGGLRGGETAVLAGIDTFQRSYAQRSQATIAVSYKRASPRSG